MRVVIYEPYSAGHHFAYVSHVVEPLSRLASELILLTSPSAARSPQFDQHLGRFAGRFQVDTEIDQRPYKQDLRTIWRQLASLRRAVDRLRPDHLYVAYGDDLAQLAGLRQMLAPCWSESVQSEALLLRGGYQYPARNALRGGIRRMWPWLLRRGPWNWIHHLNPDDLEVIRGRDPEFARRCCLMPDPVVPPCTLTKTEARRTLNLPEDGRIIGCTGLINRLKGVDLLIAAFRRARSELQPNDRLLLAGPVEDSLRVTISRDCSSEVSSGRLVVIDRSLTSEEIAVAVAASDVICTPYPRHLHSSSIVICAAAGGRPVLGNAIGWMKRTIPQFALGATCDVENPAGFSRALAKSLDEAPLFESTPAARRFVAFHSAENFARHWTKRLRERLGLPEDESLLSWDEALQGGRAEIGAALNDPLIRTSSAPSGPQSAAANT